MNRIIQEAKAVFADGFDLTRKIEERFRRSSSFLATTRTLPGTEKKPQPQSPSPYQFLFVGRLERVKGIDLLLQAMAGLDEEGVDARLTVIGGGGLEEWARAFIEKKGLGSKVTLLGNVPDETLSTLYASSDCVVIPSRSESIPLVFSEALNFDKEMIVTDVGDLGQLGRGYGVADVIPPEDPAALIKAMKERILQSRGRAAAGDNGKRAELKQLFRMETSVERFLAVYRRDS
jgi:glycosyltransferase involved in cell wall biosynthesis